ncbi:hypothetical protein J4H92_03750 [Leucobacter weissii]|uniref:Carbohydrate kinase FGGY N-terminal domain-containing protein n=1 Tax=Leucobacter weissii TaxID=1983706 RepID=A0A939SB57_9MICO|nr:FGGY family carbohydrate kinase [Leucobacter weissii]MBO1901063.1 hypothetical protein [Leucobacter weissii]
MSAAAPAPLLLGVDVGTTGIKSVVFSRTGRALAGSRRETPWTVVAEGAETTAEQLRDAALDSVREAVDAAPPGRIAGIGVASFAESGVLLDPDGRGTAPVIAWYDRRDASELNELEAALGSLRFSATTGLPFAQQWSITKGRWLSDHAPKSGSRTIRRLSVAEWIAVALGGRAATEPSLASRTGWFSLRERSWWPEALEFSRVRESWLPETAEAGTDLGAVRDGVHPRLTGARIAVAGHDHQAAAVGAGAWRPGEVLDSCGTAEALVRTAEASLDLSAIERLTAGGVTVGWHALPGRWCLLGATEGGRVLGALLARLGVDDLAGGIDDRARALPDTGLRIRADAAAGGRAALVAEGDPAALWRAAVEGVTEDAGRLARLMERSAGPSARFIAVGGWTASRALIDAKRRILGAVDLPRIDEAGARGAALFAGIAAGMWEDASSSAF